LSTGLPLNGSKKKSYVKPIRWMMLIVVLALCGSQDSDGSEARTSTYVQHRRDVKVVANARRFRHRQRRGVEVLTAYENMEFSSDNIIRN
jgi:hypothetical protein